MADLIDRKAAIDALHEWEGAYNWGETCLEDREIAYSPSDVIEALPQAEPEVVRCKDCTYSEGFPWSACPMLGKVILKDDDFCSQGERRIDDN